MPLRHVCLALALLGTLSAAAQTDAEAHFGLAVGNAWEYDLYEGAPWSDTMRVRRARIVGVR